MVKSVTMDTAFLKQHGFKTGSNEIRGIEITPMINFKDITENFSQNERVLEALLRNVEFKDEEAISNSFYSGYKFHQVDFVLSNSANQKTIDNVLAYLNNNEIIKRSAQNGKTVLEQNIAMASSSLNSTFLNKASKARSFCEKFSVISLKFTIGVISIPLISLLPVLKPCCFKNAVSNALDLTINVLRAL